MTIMLLLFLTLLPLASSVTIDNREVFLGIIANICPLLGGETLETVSAHSCNILCDFLWTYNRHILSDFLSFK